MESEGTRCSSGPSWGQDHGGCHGLTSPSGTFLDNPLIWVPYVDHGAAGARPRCQGKCSDPRRQTFLDDDEASTVIPRPCGRQLPLGVLPTCPLGDRSELAPPLRSTAASRGHGGCEHQPVRRWAATRSVRRRQPGPWADTPGPPARFPSLRPTCAPLTPSSGAPMRRPRSTFNHYRQAPSLARTADLDGRAPPPQRTGAEHQTFHERKRGLLYGVVRRILWRCGQGRVVDQEKPRAAGSAAEAHRRVPVGHGLRPAELMPHNPRPPETLANLEAATGVITERSPPPADPFLGRSSAVRRPSLRPLVSRMQSQRGDCVAFAMYAKLPC